MKKTMILGCLLAIAQTTLRAQTPNDSVSYERSLQEVVVKSRLPKEKVIAGGRSVRIVGTTLARSGSALDVLDKMPGVRRKLDGTFEVVGKGKPAIYVDGRLSRDSKLLESMKSADIKKVEVLTSPGPQYDANAPAVILISTLKKGDDGWTLGGMSQATWNGRSGGSQQVDVSYRTGKLEVLSSLRYDMNHTKQEAVTDITTHVDTLWLQQAESRDRLRNQSVYGNVAFNFQLTKALTTGAMYEVKGSPDSKEHDHNITDVWGDDMWKDQWDTHEWVRPKARADHHVNVYLNGDWGKWAFNINGDLTMNGNRRASTIFEDSKVSNDYRTTTSENTLNHLYALKAVGTRNWKAGHLSLGTELTYTKRHTSFTGYEGVIDGTDDDIKDHNTAVFASWQWQWGSQTQMEVGLRYEHVTYDFYEAGRYQPEESKVYNHIYPTFSVITALGDIRLNLGYQMQTMRPAYEMLKSSVSYGNRMSYMAGVPDLQPTYIHSADLGLSWRDLTLGASWHHIKDDIFFDLQQQRGHEKISIHRFVNHPSRNTMELSLAYSPTFGFWQPMLAVNATRQWLKVNHLGQEKNMDGWMTMVQFNNAFRLPHAWLAQVESSWTPAGKMQNMALQSSGYLNLSIQKEWCEGQYSLQLQGTDLLRTQREGATFFFSKTCEYRSTKSGTRGVTLTFRYALNHKQMKYKGERAGLEERNRL